MMGDQTSPRQIAVGAVALVVFARVTFAAEVCQIELDLSFERLFGLLQCAPNQVRHAPGTLVRNLQVALYGLGGKAALGVREHHECVEPQREGDLRLLEDGTGSRSNLTRTAGTVVFSPSFNSLEYAAAGALLFVPELEQEVQTLTIRGEPLVQTPQAEVTSRHQHSIAVFIAVWGYSPRRPQPRIFSLRHRAAQRARRHRRVEEIKVIRRNERPQVAGVLYGVKYMHI